MNDPLNSYLYEEPISKISRPQLEENILYINNSLISFGLPTLGDLFSDDLFDIKKTVDCMYLVLEQRQKDLHFKSMVQERIQKLESEKIMYQQKIEFLNEDKSLSNSEVGKVQNKLLQEVAKWKKEKEKISSERDDLRKEITKLVNKESKLWHEIKKKETLGEKMKEQLRKALGDKEMLYQNHIDLIQPFRIQAAKPSTEKSDSEFNNLITRGYDENQTYLLNENQELRHALETVQKELHILIIERRKMIMNNEEKIPNINLIHINSQIFQAPFQSVSEDLVDTFIENIRRFKEFMQLTSSIL